MNYKELTNEQIDKILEHTDSCILCVAERNQPYAIPMKCKVKKQGCKYLFSLQSCDHGMKTHCINENPRVCLYFYHITQNTLKSVVVFGCAKMCEKSSEFEKKIIEIEVTSTNVSGRAFYEDNLCCDGVTLDENCQSSEC